MRDIKFRAWNHFTDKMVTVSGLSYDQNMKIDEVCILSSSFSWEDAEYLEVMQYTGLKDKNGKEIYEGDIVRWRMDTFSGCCKAVVQFKDGCWLLEHNHPYIIKTLLSDAVKAEYDPIEIKGNIYENPGLVGRAV